VTSDLFLRLKEETAEAHRQIEERVPVFRPGFSLDDYGRLLESFYGFWAPLETNLGLLESLKDPELDLANRFKTSLLENDLRILGRNPATARLCNALPNVDTFPRGIGCLYVLEGSTLGSRFIARQLEESLQLRESSGAAFFNAYGESVARRWLAFKSFATARVRTEEADEVVKAARMTFERFDAWLAAPAADADPIYPRTSALIRG
jgi:heme oxygenase (biliverdin-IX-beta and delta-forming)